MRGGVKGPGSGAPETGSISGAVKSAGVAPYEALRRQLDLDEEEFARETQALAGQGRLVELLPGSVIADASSTSCRAGAPDS
jgi:hypothetical protein